VHRSRGRHHRQDHRPSREAGWLAVIARQSTNQYSGRTKPASVIAEELGVDYLMEGTVQVVHSGDGTTSVRIRPQLIRALDESHVWADTFTVPLSAPARFRVQAAVANDVAEALDVSMCARRARSGCHHSPRINVVSPR
jgi:TolB-like protein